MRAAVYCRVSTTMQEDNYSLPTQEEACRRHAATLGYAVTAVHQDIHSGYELWERKGLTALREAARTGAYDAIIAYEPDRLSRRQIHSAVLIDECERYGVALLFVIGQHDKTALGEFLANVRAFTAEMEREKFRERSMRGIQARMKSGKLRPSNRPLFGYQWIDPEDKGSYAIDEEHAAIVRRIYVMAASGVPLRRIADTLTEEGVQTANGATRWNHNVVRTMLHHPAYKGIARGNHTQAQKIGGKQKRTERPEEEHIHLPEGTIPAIIAEDVWGAVQERLTRNKEEATRNNHDPEAFLVRGGFVVCGYCGRPIRTVWRKDCPGQSARSYYANDPHSDPHRDCPSFAMSAQKLDAIVWGKVCAVVTEPQIVAEQIAKLRHDDPTAADLTGVDRALAEVERKRKNLTGSLSDADDPDTRNLLLAELKVLAGRKRDLETERETISARQASWQASQEQLTDLEAWIRVVGNNIESLNYQQRRDLLAALSIQVTLYRKDHVPRYEITASLPLDAGEETQNGVITGNIVEPRNMS